MNDVALLGLEESERQQGRDEEITTILHAEKGKVRHMVTEKIPVTLLLEFQPSSRPDSYTKKTLRESS